MEKNRRREKNKALYISKLMYRGSIPKTSPFFRCWRCCAPLYIAKLQDKALCRLNTRLQKEFTRENIKLKIFGKSVVRAWRNRGFQRYFRKCEVATKKIEMGKNRRKEKNRALYISKLMYRGSIPQYPISCGGVVHLYI